jgi:hypothetical protein
MTTQRRKLSELEGVSLGIIYKQQPCTAYRVRSELKEAPSSLKVWITAGVDQDLISSVTDPIRSRTFFLNVLSAPKRQAYLDRLIALMESYLSETKDHLEQKKKTGELIDYLGSLGAMKVTEARLDWLRVVRKQLSKS